MSAISTIRRAGWRGFAATGLKCASVILCGKLFTMEQRLLLRSLGHLERDAVAALDRALAAVAGLAPRK